MEVKELPKDRAKILFMVLACVALASEKITFIYDTIISLAHQINSIHGVFVSIITLLLTKRRG